MCAGSIVSALFRGSINLHTHTHDYHFQTAQEVTHAEATSARMTSRPVAQGATEYIYQ